MLSVPPLPSRYLLRPDARGTVVANVYSTDFFDNQRDGSLGSATIILPLLIDIFRPTSLIDVGCGQGTWSKTALALGIGDQIGVDGDWARPVLAIPHDRFRARDLAAPFDLGRTFDLAISTEVGEHIAAQTPTRSSAISSATRTPSCSRPPRPIKAACITSTSNGRHIGPGSSTSTITNASISCAGGSGTIAASPSGTGRTC